MQYIGHEGIWPYLILLGHFLIQRQFSRHIVQDMSQKIQRKFAENSKESYQVFPEKSFKIFGETFQIFRGIFSKFSRKLFKIFEETFTNFPQSLFV